MLDLPSHVRATLVALVTATCILVVTVSPDPAFSARAHELVLLGHLAALALGLRRGAGRRLARPAVAAAPHRAARAADRDLTLDDPGVARA
jgi:hypothetical protein